VPKARKYPCAALGSCKRRPRIGEKSNWSCLSKDGKWRPVKNLRRCWLVSTKNQGRVVSYKQLNLVPGHKSVRPQQLHILRQRPNWSRKLSDVWYLVCWAGLKMKATNGMWAYCLRVGIKLFLMRIRRVKCSYGVLQNDWEHH